MIALFILIVAILNFILGFYVFLNNPKGRINISFGLSSFLIGLWVFLNFIFIKYTSIYVLQAIYTLAPFIIISIAWWVASLQTVKPSKSFVRINALFILFNCFWGVLMFISPQMIEKVNSALDYTTGSFFNVFTVYILILFFIFIIYFSLQYRKSDKIFRDQMRLIFLGIMMTVVIAAVVGFVLPAFGITRFNFLDSPSSIFFIIFSFYSIIKYKFLNVRVIGTEVFATFLVFLSFLGLLRWIDLSDLVLSAAIFGATIIFAGLLIRSVFTEIKRREEVEKLNVKLNKAAVELKARAKHLEKLLQMRSEFLDIASHQLKTPVSVIRGTLSMFQDGSMDKVSKAEQKKFLNNVFQKANKLNVIINDILRASEVDTDEFVIDKNSAKPIQIEDVATCVYNDLIDSAQERKLKLEIIKPAKKLPPILSNADFLEQALSNLVNNAIKYTAQGQVKIILSQDQDNIIIKVEDSGVGIPLADQKKMFDKFARASNAVNMYTDGSGLGLFIAKKIIEAHKGGQISFVSQEGRGTTFTVTMPIIKK
ncbi:MAG: HAMP domain-containing sensor histidine kinase [Patescibacteria group bacterium]